MKLAHKLLLMTLVPAGLITVVGLDAISASERSLNSTIQRNGMIQARGVMEELESLIEFRTRQWARYAQDPSVRAAVLASNRSCEQLADLEEYLAHHDRLWRSDAPGSMSGELIESTISRTLRADIDKINLLEGDTVFGEVFIANRFGAVVAMSNPTSDYRQDDELWWQETMRVGHYIGDPAFDESADLWAVELCVRIDDELGQPLGVIKSVMNMQEVFDLLAKLFIVDPTSNRVLRLTTEDGTLIHSTSAAEVVDRSAGSSPAELHQPDPNTHLIATVTPDVAWGLAGFEWAIHIHTPVHEALAPVAVMRQRIGLTVVTATVLSLVAGLWWSRRMSRRTTAVLRMTERIGKGEFNAHLDLPGGDELSFIAAALSQMAARLSEVQELEREKTALRDSVEAMESVLAVVGHELRTPLAAIRATAEYLLTFANAMPAESRSFVKSIQDESVRLAQLVNDMLDAARLNGGRVSWEWETADIGEISEAAIAIVRPLIDDSKVELTTAIKRDELVIRGDRDGLQRVLINFLSNSAKHTSSGHVRISGRRYSVRNEEWVELCIEDSGGGIPEEMIRKLGKAFILGSGVTGSNYVKGSGLGLAICKGVVAAFAGAITVKSEPGFGATFFIRLRADLDEPVPGTGADLEITSEIAEEMAA